MAVADAHQVTDGRPDRAVIGRAASDPVAVNALLTMARNKGLMGAS